MESFIFTIIIWILCAIVHLVDNTTVKAILAIIELIVFLAQIIYLIFKYRG